MYLYISRRCVFIENKILHGFGENAIMNYTLSRSHPDPVNSLYTYVSIYISRRSFFIESETLHGFSENAMMSYALSASHADRVVCAYRNVGTKVPHTQQKAGYIYKAKRKRLSHTQTP
jgi:hypothetical protein